ncbi:MAG: hypothetical protein ACI4FX_02935 [Agathobacter sp.]
MSEVTMNPSVLSEDKREEKRNRVWMVVFAIGLLLMIATMLVVNAHAGLPDNIKTAVEKIYGDVKTIVTPIAALSFVVALLISFLSHNQRAVDTARQTAKGILVTWVVIMLVGAIFTYADDLLKGFSDNTLPSVSNTTTTTTTTTTKK